MKRLTRTSVATHSGRFRPAGSALKLVKRALAATALLAVAVSVTLVATASASAPVVGIVAPIAPFTAGTPFASGQTVSVAVPAGTLTSSGAEFAPHLNLTIAECAAPNGVQPTLPSECDEPNTEYPKTVTAVNGGFSISDYMLLALPDPNLSPSPISCGDTAATECDIYVGTSIDDFTQPHLFSSPFYINIGNGNDDGNDGVGAGDGSPPAAATQPSAALSTVTATPTSATADGSDPSTVTVTLEGTNSSNATVPISNAPVNLTQGSGQSVITTSPGTTNAEGVATFTVTDTHAEKVTYTATSGSTVVTETAQVNFAAPVVSVTNSTVAAASPTVALNTVSTVTVTLRDQSTNAQPVAGTSVTLSANSGAAVSITTPTQSTNPSGVATFSVEDADAEPVVFTATSGSAVISQTASVTFGTLTVSPTDSTVVAASSTPSAGTGSSSGTTVTVTLLTSGGKFPVAGKEVALAASSTTAVVDPSTAATTNSSGVATFNVTDPTEEQVTFTATDQSDSDLDVGSVSVTFGASGPVTVSPTASTVTFISSNPPTATTPADGTSPFSVFVTVKNTANSAVVGDVVTLTPTASKTSATVTGLVPSGSSTTGATGANGVAEFQVRDTAAESVTFTVTDKTANVVIQPSHPVTLTFTSGDPDGVQSTVVASPTAVAANGSASSTITVTVQDHFGNNVAGQAVQLNQGSGHSIIAPTSATTNASGVATFTVTDTTNEVVTYIAVDTSDLNLALTETATITFGSPPPTLPVSADSVIVSNYSSVPADGQTAATVSVELFDGNGLPVAGRTVALSPSKGSSKVSPATQTTDKTGTAAFQVTDTTAESVTLTATDTADNVPVSGSVTISFVTPTVAAANSGAHLNKPIVGIAPTPDGGGYWLVAMDGGVFSFGDATFHGSTGALNLNKPIVGIAPTPDGAGYWLVASDGGVFSFGDATFHGSTGSLTLNKPIVGMASTPDGGGYWLVASDGGVFAFGDAVFEGSTGGIHLNSPVVGIAATGDGLGYWLVAADGGVFSFGDAGFHGSAGALHLNSPVVGMTATPDSGGYWLVAADGGIFTYGDAGFHGSTGSLQLNSPIVGMATLPDGSGYWLTAGDGGVFAGNAQFHGSAA